MKIKIAVFLVLFAALGGSAFGQGFRFDNQVSQELLTTAIPGATNVLTVPSSAQIALCTFPANAVPCTNKATTYASNTLGTPCATSTQIVLTGTTACIANPDTQGNWGVWLAQGQYAYTITLPGGVNLGPYWLTVGIPLNPLTLTNAGTFTNLAMNEYMQSMLNGQTANMFHTSGQPGFATEALSVGAIVPSNATVQNINGVASYISTPCDSRIGGVGSDRLQCNAVAFYSDTLATANHAAAWGYNPVVHDSASGTNLTGIELDMGFNFNVAFAQGIVIETTGSGTLPGGASAFLLNSAQGTAKFFEGYVAARGALGLSSGVGLGVVLDGIGFGGSNASASIAFTGYDAGNVPRTASIKSDLNGNLIINPNSGNAYSFNNSGGGIGYAPNTFAALGTPANGNHVFCSDCTIANPCAGAGTGAFAKRLNGVWVCN